MPDAEESAEAGFQGDPGQVRAHCSTHPTGP